MVVGFLFAITGPSFISPRSSYCRTKRPTFPLPLITRHHNTMKSYARPEPSHPSLSSSQPTRSFLHFQVLCKWQASETFTIVLNIVWEKYPVPGNCGSFVPSRYRKKQTLSPHKPSICYTLQISLAYNLVNKLLAYHHLA